MDTTTLWTPLFASLPPTLVALAALISSLRNGKKSDKIAVKTEEIHEQGNSHSLAQQAKIDGLTTEVKSLTANKAESKQTAALLAQAVATAPAQTADRGKVLASNRGAGQKVKGKK